MVRLGQNFLADPNILEVIARAARLAPDDVVLEVGGGLGVLSRHLAPRVAHLHVVEIDRSLAEPLQDALSAYPNVEIHWGDAMRIDLAALTPPPTKLVANLPYGIAASLLLRTIELLPSLQLWIAMVQREVGERLAARPAGGKGGKGGKGGSGGKGGKGGSGGGSSGGSSGGGSGGGSASASAYGLSSVLAQLSCEVTVIRRIPRTVFRPPPNVDSVLVQMVRTGPAASQSVRALARAAFAHRRKALARSVSMTAAADGGALAPISRERIQEALCALGLPADVRAERLSAERMRELARLLGLDDGGEGCP